MFHRYTEIKTSILISTMVINNKMLHAVMHAGYQPSKYKTPIIKSNQIKSLLLSHHHSTSALVSEILKSVLQTVQKTNTTIYIWTVHIYRLYRRQCAKYTYIYSVHIVYYKDILNYQYTLYTVCTHLHYSHIYT